MGEVPWARTGGHAWHLLASNSPLCSSTYLQGILGNVVLQCVLEEEETTLGEQPAVYHCDTST